MLAKDQFIQACCLSAWHIVKQITRQCFLHLLLSDLCIGMELGLTRAEALLSILSGSSAEFVILRFITVSGLCWSTNCGKRRKVMTKSRKRNYFFVLPKISRWRESKRVIWWSSRQCSLMKQPLTVNLVISPGAGSYSCWQQWRSCSWPAVSPQESMHTGAGKTRRANHGFIFLLSDPHCSTSRWARALCDSSLWASFFIWSPLGKIKDPAEKLRSRRS